MPEKRRRTSFYRQGRGLNLDASRLTLAPGEAFIARNCDRDTDHAIRKRNGSRRDGTIGARVVGVYNHEYSSHARGRVHRHLWMREDGVLFHEKPEASLTEVLGVEPTGGSTTYASFATVQGDTFSAIGFGRTTVYDGEKRWWAGIEGPTVAPTVAHPNPGPLTGRYRYRVTYIFRTPEGRLVESEVSPSSDVVEPSADAISVAWTAHPSVASGMTEGERVTGYRLYRTQDLDGGGTEDAFLFVEEFPDINQTAYEDSTEDLELGNLSPPVGTRALPPYGVSLLIPYKSRLFYLGSCKEPLVGYYSSPGAYEAVIPDNKFVLTASSLSRITGAVVHSGVLVVFTERELYHVIETSPGFFTPVLMTNSIGCIAPGSVQSVGGSVVFRGENGFYAWDLNQVLYLSEKIQPQVASVPIDNARSSFGALYLKRNHYYCAAQIGDGPRGVWVYDYSTENVATADALDVRETRMTRSWFLYDGETFRPTAIGSLRALTDRAEVVRWGDSAGNLYTFDVGDTDDGRPIDMEYEFPHYPHEDGFASAASYALRVSLREWQVVTDQWQGTAEFRYRYQNGPVTEFLTAGVFTRDEGDHLRRTAMRCMNNGTDGIRLSVRHGSAGAFRVLGHELWWRFNGPAQRHQVL